MFSLEAESEESGSASFCFVCLEILQKFIWSEFCFSVENGVEEREGILRIGVLFEWIGCLVMGY